jgi:hypothetical protein
VLVVGVAVAVLAVIGIGIGIYFAASSGSGGQARLLATPLASGVSQSSVTPSPSPLSSSSGQAGAEAHARPSAASLGGVERARTAPATRSRIGEPSETRAVADTIQRHFSLISEHKFSAAYALLAPSLQSGESSWVAAHREDGIYNVEVAVHAKLDSANTATATIAKMTTLDGHGCKKWSGSWKLTKIAGEWRISESGVSATAC